VNATANPAKLDGLLIDVRWLMRELLEEGRVSQEDFNVISTTPREKKELNWHPIQVLAKYRLTDQTNTHQLLDVDFLTHWLGEKAGIPVCHIDPLKVHVDQVTNVMSYAFAERHGIVNEGVGNTHDVLLSFVADSASRCLDRDLEETVSVHVSEHIV